MDFLPPFVILLAAFVDGEALVQIITDPRALSMPTLTGQQLRGFALALSKVVLNGGAGEVVQLARSNLRTIPRPRRSIWSTACSAARFPRRRHSWPLQQLLGSCQTGATPFGYQTVTMRLSCPSKQTAVEVCL